LTLKEKKVKLKFFETNQELTAALMGLGFAICYLFAGPGKCKDGGVLSSLSRPLPEGSRLFFGLETCFR